MSNLGLNEFEDLFLRFSVLTRQYIQRPFEDNFKNEISPMQMNALGLLAINGTMSMSDLSEQMHVTKQQMTQIIGKLSDNDLIKRDFCPDDRRIIKVSISPKAVTLLKNGIKRFSDCANNPLKALSDSEKQEFIHSAETIISHCKVNP